MRAEWARRRSQGRDTVAMVMQGLRQRGHAPDRKHFLPNETHPQVFRQVRDTLNPGISISVHVHCSVKRFKVR